MVNRSARSDRLCLSIGKEGDRLYIVGGNAGKGSSPFGCPRDDDARSRRSAAIVMHRIGFDGGGAAIVFIERRDLPAPSVRLRLVIEILRELRVGGTSGQKDRMVVRGIAAIGE